MHATILFWFIIGVFFALNFIFAWLSWGLNNDHFKRAGKSLAFRLFFSFFWHICPLLGNIAHKKFLRACPDGNKYVRCEGVLIAPIFVWVAEGSETLPKSNNYKCSVCGLSSSPKLADKINESGHLRDSENLAKFKKTFWYAFL